jgi:myo-inositol catabolism protein IolC
VSAGGRAYVLAIDHRASFRRWAVDVLGHAAQDGQLRDLKVLVADALAVAVAEHDGDELGLLVDTEYGTVAMERARSAGVRVVVPAERSGMAEFVFEHGDDFPAVMRASGADAVKALVRYNPASDPERNRRSTDRLTRLSRWCEASGTPLMLELLVPLDADDIGGVASTRDDRARLTPTCTAVDELRTAGLHPQWWKLEGQPDARGFDALAHATGASMDEASCLVLGRGVTGPQLSNWIDLAAATAGFSGFAVGRSLWAGPLRSVLQGRLSGRDATRRIAAAYLELIDRYERAEAAGAPGPPAAERMGEP